ncbi:MAG: protein YgfX [Burkholderiales bacterium]
MSGERAFRVHFSPSRGLAAIIVAMHGGAGICAGALVPGVTGICLGLLIAGLGFAAAWDRALLRGRRSARGLETRGDDSVVLELADGERVRLRISPRRFVSGLVVILPAVPRVHRTIVVARDMLGPDSFRALRLWALWGRVPGIESAPPLT